MLRHTCMASRFFLSVHQQVRRSRPRVAALIAVLIFHATWVTVDQIFPSLASTAPIIYGSTRLFSLRTDVDSLVCGLLAAIGLHRALAGRNPTLNLMLAGWGLTLVLLLNSRAGLLAFIVQIIVVLLLGPARRRLVNKYDPRVAVAILLVCAPFVAVGLTEGNSVHRLTLALSGGGAESEANGAIGTKNARAQSWNVLVHYILRDSSRTIRGVGFGPDFLHDSGADILLLGNTAAAEEDVRSPHNYLLNTWARLGLIGVGLILGILFTGLRVARLVVRHAAQLREDDTLAILLVASIPVAAFVGVVLESPFGSLPYFRALGHLSARVCQTGAAVPFGHLSDGALPSGRDLVQQTRSAQRSASSSNTA